MISLVPFESNVQITGVAVGMATLHAYYRDGHMMRSIEVVSP